jgi:murein L,D-transpeptidase YcbB/YkuD
MNVPLEFRIDQIRVNMERLRWLPETYGEEYILVNLPEFRLRYYQKGIKLEEMKIVIGEIEHYTPVLKDTLRYIVFNPNWNLPRSIAVKEKLPKIKADPYYLEKNDYLLFRDGYRGSDTIDPYEVDWEPVTQDNFPYYMVQSAGKYNALGRVKFLFPNNHAIYMHDTPADHLFKYNERDFSHGCIRLDEPFRLAEKILEDQKSYMEIQDILDSEEPTTVKVEDLIRVFFLYRTAWVDDDDRLNFREDLYNFDLMTAEKL